LLWRKHAVYLAKRRETFGEAVEGGQIMMTATGKGRAFPRAACVFKHRVPDPESVERKALRGCLSTLGFDSPCKTSRAMLFSPDGANGTIGRAEMIAHVAAIAAATDLPVRRGFGKRLWRTNRGTVSGNESGLR